jgi:hypothetical protein
MKKIIYSIRRSRKFKAIQKRNKENRPSETTINIFDDLSDLSQVERRNFFFWHGVIKAEENLIRSHFNLDHWRKVKEARLSIH